MNMKLTLHEQVNPLHEQVNPLHEQVNPLHEQVNPMVYMFIDLSFVLLFHCIPKWLIPA